MSISITIIFQRILPVLFIISAVLAGAFFVFPKYENFTKIQADIEEGRARVQRGEEALVKLRAAKREADARQDDFAKIDIAIPQDMALPAVYHELQRLGLESELAVSNLDSTETELQVGNSTMKRATVSLELQGPYGNIKNFLAQAKSFARMLNTQAVGVDSVGSETLRLQVDINAYSYDP